MDRLTRTIWLTVALALIPTFVFAEDEKNLAESLAGGKGSVSFYLRYEHISENSFDLDAYGLFLRSQVNYRTHAWNNLDFFIEAADVTSTDDSKYNNNGSGSSNNGVTDRPVISDPEETQINQVYLRFRPENTVFLIGREEINYDDQRFVGAVAWRLNHQTFEDLSFENQSLEPVTFNYAFLTRVHRVNLADQPMTSHFVHVALDLKRIGEITGYAYLLDFSDAGEYPLSTNTFGIEFDGSQSVGKTHLLYELEFARQVDTAKNPNRVEANYWNIYGGANISWFTLRAAMERLEGNAMDGQFNTTFGTNHKFNGWADRFLTTPTEGLQDVYVRLDGVHGALDWTARYHDFRETDGDGKYGTEFDLQAQYETPWRQEFAVKTAFYSADTFSTNTSKLWIWSTYTF